MSSLFFRNRREDNAHTLPLLVRVKALDECRRKNKAHGEHCQVEKHEESSVFNFHHLPSMTQ